MNSRAPDRMQRISNSGSCLREHAITVTRDSSSQMLLISSSATS